MNRAVIAALSGWHEEHEAAARADEAITALPAHVMVEAYSVLTRLPSGLAVPATDAADAFEGRFGDAVLRLPKRDRAALLKTLAGAGVFGGASHDGLIALEAHAHVRVLLSLDRRAREPYRRLRVAFQAI